MRQFTILLTTLLLVTSVAVFGQDEESEENEIFFVQQLQPHNDQIEAFENALQEHNQTYHSEDGVMTFYEISGKTHGHYEFVLGPYTWTEWENRELSEDHRMHFNNEIMPLVKHAAEPSAWKHLPNFELNQPDISEYSRKSIISILTLKDGQYARFMKTLEQWHKANAESEDFDGSYNIFSRQLSGENQIAFIYRLEDGWAELDEEQNLRDRFENIHGKSDWDLWAEDAEKVVESNEVGTRVYLPNLSVEADN